jgi:protein-disulfide isomerase
MFHLFFLETLMKKILISLISLLALSIALPSISSAYTFNQQDQAILEAVYTRLQVLQQEDSQRIQDIHQSIQKVLPQYSGRSFAILEAIINHVELKNPTLRNYDGEITSEQIRQFKTAPAVGENNAQYLIIEYSDIQCPFCERFMSNNTIIDFMNSHP